MEARSGEKKGIIDALILEINAMMPDPVTQDALIGIESLVSLASLKRLLINLNVDYDKGFADLTEFMAHRWEALSGTRLLDLYHHDSRINSACVIVAKKLQSCSVPPPKIFQIYIDFANKNWQETISAKVSKAKLGVEALFSENQEASVDERDEGVFAFLYQYLLISPLEKQLIQQINKKHWKYLMDNISIEIKRRDDFVRLMAYHVPQESWEDLLQEMSQVHLARHIFGYRILEICREFQRMPDKFQEALNVEIDRQLDDVESLKLSIVNNDHYDSEDEVRALLFILLSLYEKRRDSQHSYSYLPKTVGNFLPSFIMPYSRDQKVPACRLSKQFVREHKELSDLQGFLVEKNCGHLRGPLTERGSTLAGMMDLLRVLSQLLKSQDAYKPSVRH